MDTASRRNLKHHVPTFLAEVVQFIAVLSLFPALVLSISGDTVGTAILISFVPIVLIARSYRDTIEIDLEQAQIVVTRNLFWCFLFHRKIYSFREVQCLKYITSADGAGMVELSFWDGKKFVIRPNSDPKECFEFWRSHISPLTPRLVRQKPYPWWPF